jgi:transposase
MPGEIVTFWPDLCKRQVQIRTGICACIAMLKNHHLARVIGDVGIYEFKRQLLYKAAWYGAWGGLVGGAAF